MSSIMDTIQERINRIRQLQAEKSEDLTERVYQCPKCRDEEGFIITREDGSEAWKFCECAERKRIERLFKASQITEEFRKKTFDNFDVEGRPQAVKDAYEAAKEYVADFENIRHQRRNSIALLGVPGCGKTHLLMAIANNLMQNGVGVLYFPWVEGFNNLKANLDLSEEKVYRLQTVPVLYIDDLFKGREKPTEFQREQLFAIVNHRYLNNLPILISSEWDFDRICAFDMAIGSRLYEMCRDYAVLLQGGLELNYRLSGEE